MALNTPKKNVPGKNQGHAGRKNLAGETTGICSQTRSKASLNVDNGGLSDHAEGSKRKQGDLGSKLEDSSILEGMLGSLSANSTPTGVDLSSRTLDRIEQESELLFIYNPLSPLKKSPLIKENE